MNFSIIRNQYKATGRAFRLSRFVCVKILVFRLGFFVVPFRFIIVVILIGNAFVRFNRLRLVVVFALHCLFACYTFIFKTFAFKAFAFKSFLFFNALLLEAFFLFACSSFCVFVIFFFDKLGLDLYLADILLVDLVVAVIPRSKTCTACRTKVCKLLALAAVSCVVALRPHSVGIQRRFGYIYI